MHSCGPAFYRSGDILINIEILLTEDHNFKCCLNVANKLLPSCDLTSFFIKNFVVVVFGSVI